MKAHEIAKKLGLEKSTGGYECYTQNEIGNDELIAQLDNEAISFYHSNDEDFESELFVFIDNSCINRQDDEYFINDNVDHLDSECLDRVGYPQ